MKVGAFPSSEAAGPPLTPATEALAGKLKPLKVPPVSVTVTVGVAWVMAKVVDGEALA